jgi:chemotaxis signal transduction protein
MPYEASSRIGDYAAMTADTEELYSLLIPLAEDRLIVPRACVAEVVRFSKPDKAPGAHFWMLGNVSWNGRPLPVVSFEGALGKAVPPATAVHASSCSRRAPAS